MIRPRQEITSAPPSIHGGPEAGGRTDPELDFSHNVNAWGPPPSVVAAIRSAEVGSYPDPGALGPRKAVAKRWDLPVGRIRFAAGAVELIHRVCRTFLRPGDRVLIPGPTFGEYARASALAGARVDSLSGSPPDYELPWTTLISKLRAGRPRLVFVCAPNSPTGEDPERRDLTDLLGALPEDSLLVLDESFRSFPAGTFRPPSFPDESRVLHLRSLTKDFALAGVRVGVASGDPRILSALDSAAVPWSESAPAQAAAVAAMDDEAIRVLEENLVRLKRDRDSLSERLCRVGWEPLPSSANFLLCRVGDGERVSRALFEEGVRVRNCASFGLSDHVRVAVRTPDENAALIRAVKAIR